MDYLTYQPPSLSIQHRRLATADRPGAHLWIVSAAWQVADPGATTGGMYLDFENVLLFNGAACYKCEKPYSEAVAARPCGTSTRPSRR